MKCQKVYIHDSEEVRRYFAPDLRWRLVPGDNVAVFDVPSITKSRPVGAGSANDVLLKLNKVRHFIFLKDRKRWEDKKPMAIFRGRVANKKERKEFVRMYAGHELVDAGCVDRPSDLPERCYVDKISLYAHFDYKFIVCLEGNDVASNLKWVMNSNSIAVMPRPRNETWFMEGRLEPGVHYVEIRDDYTDLEDRLRYYMSHPEEAQMILDNAHRWTAQFKDKKTERLVSLGVMQNYLVNTGQLDEPLV